MLRRLALTALAASLLLGVARCDDPPPFPKPDDEIDLWPGTAPGEIPGEVGPEKWEYTDSWRIRNVTNPSVSLYLPPEGTKMLRGVFVIVSPGGAYEELSVQNEGTDVSRWLGSLGVATGVLKYRVPRRHHREAMWTAPLEDAQRAAGLVRSRLEKWGLREDALVGHIGFSAGGHLVATHAAHMDKRTYAAVDEADDLSCGLNFSMLVYPAYLTTTGNVYELDKQAISPVGPSKPPPAWTMQAMDDQYFAECAIGYALMLKGLGVKASTFIGPDGGHGYALLPSDHLVASWPAVAAQWMKTSGFLVN